MCTQSNLLHRCTLVFPLGNSEESQKEDQTAHNWLLKMEKIEISGICYATDMIFLVTQIKQCNITSKL